MNLKASLSRKLGPLPAWAWAILGFGLVWYFRNKLSGGASGTGTGSVTPTPPEPQAQQVLQPGESIYDPNTGQMTTAPGGDTSTPPDWSAIAQMIADDIVAGENKTGGGSGSGGGNTGKKGGGAGKTVHKPPKLGRGAVRAPYGRNKPKNKPGYRTVGQGGGFWEYVKKPKLGKGGIRAAFGRSKPADKKGYKTVGQGGGFWEYLPNKRSPKTKNQHGAKTKTTKPPKPGTKSKTRSNATMKVATGGRTTARTKGTLKTGRVRGGAKVTASTQRAQSTKRTVPIVSQPVIRQRPVASNTPRRPAAAPSAHRTASTPPRTTRTPAKSAPKKTTARKR